MFHVVRQRWPRVLARKARLHHALVEHEAHSERAAQLLREAQKRGRRRAHRFRRVLEHTAFAFAVREHESGDLASVQSLRREQDRPRDGQRDSIDFDQDWRTTQRQRW